MSDDFADILRKRAGQLDAQIAAAADPVPPTFLLSAVCRLYGEDLVEVAREVRRDTALGRLVRKAFCMNARDLPQAKLGRPRKDEDHRRDRLIVKALIAAGLNVENACAEAAAIRGREGRRNKKGKIAEGAMRTAYARGRNSLGDLYAEPITPEELTRLRSK